MRSTPSSPAATGSAGTSGSRHLSGALYALAATIIWSGNFIVARGLAAAIQPATLSTLRWGTAFAALLPLALVTAWRQRALLRRHLGFLILSGLTGVTFFNTLLYLAGRSTSAINLALIATSSPIFMIVFARLFLGEAITYRRLAGLLAAVAGVLLLLARGEFGHLLRLSFTAGDLWMLLAAMFFALYSIVVRRKPPAMAQATLLLGTFGLGLAGLVPWAGHECWQHGLPALDGRLVLAVLYVGLGASLAAFYCWNKAVAAFGPARAGMVYYSLPLFSGIEAWALLGEPMGLLHLASGLLILGGIILATRG